MDANDEDCEEGVHLLEQLLLVRREVRPLTPQRLPRILANGLYLLQLLQQFARSIDSSHVRLATNVTGQTKSSGAAALQIVKKRQLHLRRMSLVVSNMSSALSARRNAAASSSRSCCRSCCVATDVCAMEDMLCAQRQEGLVARGIERGGNSPEQYAVVSPAFARGYWLPAARLI
jgi:hypothetical protein